MASWAERTIWWHVYPLGFTGAEKTALAPGEPVRRRLRRLDGWLDYAVELGCSGLLLGPIFAAETHRYDTVDHFEVDPRLGDREDFDHLVAEAGRRGVRIVLDGVFNHVGRSFPAFAAYAANSGLDSVTQYELWKAIWSSLNDRNFFELAWALDRHNQVLDGVMPQTFTGNHDVTRLASQLTDERHFGHALAVLLTVGGVPSIYYGDEQAFRGIKEQRADGDDEIRPAFPARPAELAPDGWPVYRLHQRLIGFRRRHPWLVRARTTVQHLTNEAIALQAVADDAGILVLLNAGKTAFRFPVDVAGFAVAETPDPGARPDDPALVPGHSWVILSS